MNCNWLGYFSQEHHFSLESLRIALGDNGSKESLDGHATVPPALPLSSILMFSLVCWPNPAGLSPGQRPSLPLVAFAGGERWETHITVDDGICSSFSPGTFMKTKGVPRVRYVVGDRQLGMKCPSMNRTSRIITPGLSDCC